MTASAVDNKAESKAHFRKGTAFYAQGQYDAAIDEYSKAYAAQPVPDILFNIAQAYRMKGDRQKAIEFYQQYLEVDPRGRAADETIDHIRMLKLELEVEALRTAQKPVPPPVPVPVPVQAEPSPSPTPEPLVAKPAPSQPPPTPVADAGTPVYQKWWLWTIVVGVAAGAAVGVGLGVGLSQPAPFNPTLAEWGPGAGR